MKTTYTPDTIVLVGGEIYIIDKNLNADNTQWGKCKFSGTITNIPNGQYRSLITHSTAKLDGVVQLDRQQFVGPVDERELAAGKASELDFKGRDYHLFKAGFIQGHNANKGVYSEQDMRNLWNKSFKCMGMNFEMALDSIVELSIPKSVTIENGAVTEITW